MYCVNCGQEVPATSRFCSTCGTAVQPVLSVPASSRAGVSTGNRMATHVKLLGWIYLVLGLLGLLGGLCFFLFFSLLGVQPFGQHFPASHAFPVFFPLAFIVGAGFLIFSVPGLIAGYGLLNYREWARILTIVLSLLNLLSFPFGTALGAYGLWILISREGEQYYRQQAALITP